MTLAMIYHHPRPVLPEGISGSQVRPYRMLQAFKALGFEVEVVTGFAKERKQATERLKAEFAKGRRYDFVYSEVSTQPTLLTESHHLPLRPGLDFGFLRWLKDRGVPIGLFYRDVHWRFEHYQKQVPWPKRALLLPLFRYDWQQYYRCIDHLFLPCLEMASVLPGPWPADRMSALPPGCVAQPVPQNSGYASHANKPLKLFYVGGVTPPLYDLRPMVEAIQSMDGVFFTLCCRQREWERVRHYYQPFDNRKIQVVHAQGRDLAGYYEEADLFMLAWMHYRYWRHTVPVKQFEALGYALPMIATSGTVTARFVAHEDVGWTVAGADELVSLLARVQADPGLLASKRSKALAARERHTWLARARTAAQVLCGGSLAR